jgi:hypothetical protein
MDARMINDGEKWQEVNINPFHPNLYLAEILFLSSYEM